MSEETDNAALANNEANNLVTEDQNVEQETTKNDELYMSNSTFSLQNFICFQKNQDDSLDFCNKIVEKFSKRF